MVLATGGVSPSTVGPFVEQVGTGVARQVARRLDPSGARDETLLALLADAAEEPGFVAYAVFEGRTAVALALLRIEADRATYLGEVVAPTAPPGTGSALLVRALHDVAAAGVGRLAVPSSPLDLGGFVLVHGH